MKLRGQACYLLLAATLLGAGSRVLADDWPEWRGAGRKGVWHEDGVLERFPPEGLSHSWRMPLASGYAGPAVAGGRVFVTDFRPAEGNRGTERVLCLAEQTGETLWTHEWPVSYAGIEPTWATGPRATPTVDGERVYVLGAMGALLSLDVETGRLLWQRDFVEDYGTTVPGWGMVGAPIVEGRLLISLVGGESGAKVVAFDKQTGEEVWRALSSAGEPGYTAPIVIDSGGVRQLIVWHPDAVTSLNPLTGKVYWEQPFDVKMGLTVATPVFDRGRLLVSSFFNGSMLLRLDPERPGAELAWKGTSSSESETDGLHALITTPVLMGDNVYGICSYGQLRALDAGSGARVWETLELTGEKARWAAGLIVRNGDRFFVNNDRGELVIARFTPRGYRELSRTGLIEPTTRGGGRRELGLVNWSHPAYANRHIVARNDREIVRASLSKP